MNEWNLNNLVHNLRDFVNCRGYWNLNNLILDNHFLNNNWHLFNYLHFFYYLLLRNDWHNFFSDLRVGNYFLHYSLNRDYFLNIAYYLYWLFHDNIFYSLALQILNHRDCFFNNLFHLNDLGYFLDDGNYFLNNFFHLYYFLYYSLHWDYFLFYQFLGYLYL